MSDERPGIKRTLIEEGTVLKGGLESSCPITVMGRIEGQICGPSIEITETGVVSGQVKVTELRSCGELAGSVEAQTVELSGRVRDQTVIRARSLEVKRGGSSEVLFGDCELCIGDEPSKEAAISGALTARPGEAVPTAVVDSTVSGRGRRTTGSIDGPSETIDRTQT